MKNISQYFNSIFILIRKYAIVSLVVCFGLSFTLTAFWIIKAQYLLQSNKEFSWVAHNRNKLLKQGIKDALKPIGMIRDYLQVSKNITKEQFHLIGNPVLSRNPSFEMIGLIMKPHNSKFVVNTLLNPQINLTYVQSRQNIYNPGHNMALDPILRDTINRAQRTEMMTVSGRISLEGTKDNKYAVMICLPLYKNSFDSGSPEEQSKQFIGFLVAVFRLDYLAHEAISYLQPRGVDLLILDQSALPEQEFLEFYASRLKPITEFNQQQIRLMFDNAETKITEVVQIADRQWSITAIANTNFKSAEAFAQGAWVVLVGGLLLTSLMTIYLIRMKYHIIERREREELFWQLQAQVFHNERLASIGEVATGVAHDINNPNNAIQTGISVFDHVWQDAMSVLREYYQDQGDFSLGGLSFEQEGESLHELISEIKDNSKRIGSIVGNLKHLGKKTPLTLTDKVNINTALKAATRILGSTIKKQTLRWEMKLANELPLIKGNSQQLGQVFIYLIQNALL